MLLRPLGWILVAIGVVACAAPRPPPRAPDAPAQPTNESGRMEAATPSAAEPSEAPAEVTEPAEGATSGTDLPGRAHFMRHCASCHGRDGRGNTPMGAKLGLADMTDSLWQRDRDDRDMRMYVRRGVPARGQPAFGPDKLDDQALAEVIAYIRTLDR